MNAASMPLKSVPGRGRRVTEGHKRLCGNTGTAIR